MELSRAEYAALYGPSTGDRVRLADTDLVVTVEADDTAPGHEPVVGFGKTIRDGQLSSGRMALEEAMDGVVTNVVLMDPVLGIRKTCLGIRDGRIAAVGRAGDPDRDPGVTVPISAATGIYAAEGLIATPGTIDTHVHLIGPQLVPTALAGGITTVAAMSYSGAFDLGINPTGNFDRLLDAWAAVPLNLLPLVRGSTTEEGFLDALLEMGGGGFKIHEDVGAYPDVVDAVLRVADRHDVQVALHADGLGETATLEETLAAIAGRAIHAYHVEGCGGGPVNLLEVVSHPNVLPSSTTPTVPFGVNVCDEHEEMIRTVHRLHPALPNDARAARARIRAWTIAAESVLHDLGAISIMSSDSMGMGRIGEVGLRAWQTAHVMRRATGEEGDANARVLRYLAKLTINPAIAHGIAGDVGSLQPGRLADVVLWRPAFFGVKPHLVIKGGFPAWGQRGSGSGSTRIAEPIVQGPLWGGLGRAPEQLGTVFTSAAGEARVRARRAGPVAVVTGTRTIGKADMVHNAATPAVEVDPVRREVRVDGVAADPAPAAELPMQRAYFLS
ncbi:urease subunit alpha [Baekduia soli]|uniref:Urease subunit alpha n=1 Tax=Baekduia soli TaxID=496014 RepID=A0A5B8U3G0_9ACTN|nr:urease subunit alpha [Baekduia soli]QEC47408.1 urease subunit alpha [Baekduia soli]